jgi:hypothetical protein
MILVGSESPADSQCSGGRWFSYGLSLAQPWFLAPAPNAFLGGCMKTCENRDRTPILRHLVSLKNDLLPIFAAYR